MLSVTMLTEAEKLSKRDDFIKSDQFGSSTYLILMTFRHNTLGILSTIGIYGKLIEKLSDKSCIDHTMKDNETVAVKQYIMLNILSWLISIIEGLFVLIHSLSENYTSVNQNMTHYRTDLVWSIIKNIKARKYNFEKILALPSVKNLNLDISEQELLQTVYDGTQRTIYEILDSLVDFYEKYNIVYNKSKHGLMFFPGGFMPDTEKKFETSSLSAYDRRQEKDMPSNYFKARPSEDYQKWFNVETHVNFNSKLFSQIGTLIENLKELSRYVTEANLNFANNCGQGYLPHYRPEEGKVMLLFFPDKEITEKEKSTLDSIQAKIIPNMVVSDYAIHIRHNFTKEELQKSVKESPITNIFMVNEADGQKNAS